MIVQRQGDSMITQQFLDKFMTLNYPNHLGSLELNDLGDIVTEVQDMEENPWKSIGRVTAWTLYGDGWHWIITLDVPGRVRVASKMFSPQDFGFYGGWDVIDFDHAIHNVLHYVDEAAIELRDSMK